MKNLIVIIFVTILLIGCKKKNVECSYLYTDSNSGLAYRGTAEVICEKCTKKQRKKAIEKLEDSDGYSEVDCEETK
jgi:hypothetical protein